MPSRKRSSSAKYEIDNPLARDSPTKLAQSADLFAERIDPEAPDYAFWRKAVLVARYQQIADLCDRISGLSEPEKKAIRRTLGFWQQPKPLRVTTITLCLAAIIQGWVQTGLNGGNTTWPKAFNLTEGDGPPDTTPGIWIFAGVNAALYFSASILGCWLSDPLQSLILGRRGAIFFSACLCLAGAIGCAFSRSWPQLLGCRVVLGAAMGAKASVTPIYGAEVAPTHLRGALVMNWQLFDAFGIFLGFTANLIVSQTGENRWRYEVASVVIPTIILLSLVWTIPESPRWLLKKGRYRDAFASFCAIRETPLQAAAELFYANAQIQAEIQLLGRARMIPDVEGRQDHEQQSNGHAHRHSMIETELRYIKQHHNKRSDVTKPTEKSPEDGCLPLTKRLKCLWTTIINRKDDSDLEEYQRCAKASFYVTRLYQLFSMPRIRRATTASLVVMISQQLCGINILQFYSTTFFHDSGNLLSNPLLGPGLSLGFGLANFVFTFPIYGFIDKRGRRFLLLSSYPGMIVSMFGACLSYNIVGDNRRLAVVIIFMFFFVFFYSWGQGPVPFAYSSEVFPLLNREAGMSFAVFANLFGAGVLALVVPQLTKALATSPRNDVPLKTGESRLLGIFTGLNVVALVLIFFLVPETSGASIGSDDAQGFNHVSLEELNYIFNVKTTKHIEYQVTVMVPWAWDTLNWKFRKFILRKDEEKPEDPYQLYTWVQVEQVNDLGRDGSSMHGGKEVTAINGGYG